MDLAERFLAALLQSLAQSAPWLVLGYALAAVIREWVPDQLLARWFSGRGMAPVARAGLTGALLPMCSCTVVPVTIGLSRSGAAPGALLAFLMTGPALSPVAILLFFTLLGPTIAGLLVVTCVVVALFTGWLGNRLLTQRPAEPRPVAADGRPVRQRLASAARWAAHDLAPEISVDLVLGLALAAAVLALLPLDLIGTWFGSQKLLTLFYVVLIGIPMYTCTVPSIPVVQSLLLAGMSPGAGVAFLLAGPATNLGELLVLKRALGARTTLLFVGGLVVGALGAGLIADNLLFAGYAYQPSAVAGTLAQGCCLPSYLPIQARPTGLAAASATIPLWHWPFVAVVAAGLVSGLLRRWQRWRSGGASCALVPGVS
jgi:hypothetical protein